MTKLTARQIGEEIEEHDKLECELVGDVSEWEYWEDYQAELDYDPADDWYEPFDDHDYGYDPYPMPFDGEY